MVRSFHSKASVAWLIGKIFKAPSSVAMVSAAGAPSAERVSGPKSRRLTAPSAEKPKESMVFIIHSYAFIHAWVQLEKNGPKPGCEASFLHRGFACFGVDLLLQPTRRFVVGVSS